DRVRTCRMNAADFEAGIARPLRLSTFLSRSPLLRLPPWPVARRLWRSGTPLAGLLALGRVGDGVVMVRVIGPSSARLEGFLLRVGRDQAIAARADEVLPARLDQGFPHGKPVFRFEKPHQGALHLPIPKPFRNIDFLSREGIPAS